MKTKNYFHFHITKWDETRDTLLELHEMVVQRQKVTTALAVVVKKYPLSENYIAELYDNWTVFEPNEIPALYFIQGADNIKAWDDNEIQDIDELSVHKRVFTSESNKRLFISGLIFGIIGLTEPNILIIDEDEYSCLTKC